MRWITAIAMTFMIFLVGCPSSEIQVPGEKIDTSEKMSGDWVPIERWALEEISPGRWFELNAAALGSAGRKVQYINVIIAGGTPASLHSDGGRVKIVSSSSAVVAEMIMYSNNDGEVRYDLIRPSGGR